MASSLHGTGLAYRDPSVRLEGFRADGAVTANAAGVDANGLRLNGDYVTDRGKAPVDGVISSVTLRGKDLTLHGISLAVYGGHFHGDGKVLDLVRYSVSGAIDNIEGRPVVAMYAPGHPPWNVLASGPVAVEGSFGDSSLLRAQRDAESRARERQSTRARPDRSRVRRSRSHHRPGKVEHHAAVIADRISRADSSARCECIWRRAIWTTCCRRSTRRPPTCRPSSPVRRSSMARFAAISTIRRSPATRTLPASSSKARISIRSKRTRDLSPSGLRLRNATVAQGTDALAGADRDRHA